MSKISVNEAVERLKLYEPSARTESTWQVGIDLTTILAALKARTEALSLLMEQPTKHPLKMSPGERQGLWKAHEAARSALSDEV